MILEEIIKGVQVMLGQASFDNAFDDGQLLDFENVAGFFARNKPALPLSLHAADLPGRSASDFTYFGVGTTSMCTFLVNGS